MDHDTFTMQPNSFAGIGMDHDTFTKQPNSFAGIGMDHDTFTKQPNSFPGIGMDLSAFTKQPNFIPGIKVEMEHDTISDLIYLAEQANETGIEILYNSNMTGIHSRSLFFFFLTHFFEIKKCPGSGFGQCPVDEQHVLKVQEKVQ